MAMMELAAQLVLCGLDSRRQLLDTSIITFGQQRRSTVPLSVGRAGSQNVCVVTLFNSPWPVCPSLSTMLSSHGGRSDGRNMCSSSVWKRLSTNANASGIYKSPIAELSPLVMVFSSLGRLQTHATIEPVVIATNRQLSSLHPVHQALVPHFRNTLDINAAARKVLINAGGVIGKTFTPHQYAMQMSSAVYKQWWRFDEQALPADLIKRGMAIPDANSKHGIKLLIEDNPYAADGLELWGAIRLWLTNYINLWYIDDATVQSDVELQSWWTEIRSVGHGDKKDEEGWPILNSKETLIQVLSTIVWIASCHHAAVNFGQYDYAGYMPNLPTITRRLIPNKGTPEFLELQRDPEAFYLSTISNQTQATVIMATTEVLSTHSSQEEFLGQRSTPNWTDDDKVLALWGEFQERISEIEELIKRRNEDKMLKNRYGAVELPYELLYPLSHPNSTSI